MDPHDESQTVPPQLDRLQKRAADDVAAVAHRYADLMRTEATAAGERALWPAALAAIGGLVCVVGVGMLVSSPAVPSRQRPLKRRLRVVAVAYVALGGAAGLVGALALASTLGHAMPRTRRGLTSAVEAIRDRL